MWHGGTRGEQEPLASCYRRASSSPPSTATPASRSRPSRTGVYSYPLDRAARVAVEATRAALEAHPEVEEARFWLFGDDAYRAFEAAL